MVAGSTSPWQFQKQLSHLELTASGAHDNEVAGKSIACSSLVMKVKKSLQ